MIFVSLILILQVDLTALITGKAIPIGLGHLDAVLKSKAYRLRRGQPGTVSVQSTLNLECLNVD
jgi:hypothetical protein